MKKTVSIILALALVLGAAGSALSDPDPFARGIHVEDGVVLA